MRSEHRTTGAEWDLGYWRRFLCYMQRPGVTKSIKRASHRHDRRTAKRAAIREQLD